MKKARVFIETFKTYEYRYLHINWGCDGKDNGYYLDGVFDTSTNQRYLDDESDGHFYSGKFTSIKYIIL